MVIQPKHYLFGALGLILAGFIYWINYTWGNSTLFCIYLSVMTFLFWFGCWLVFFEIRDNWNYRWGEVSKKDVISTFISIPIKWELQNSKPDLLTKNNSSHLLYGEWLRWTNVEEDAPIVIFVNGFSDKLDKTYQYLIPLVYAGYHVISYDNRGKGKSRKAGNKAHFYKIIRDLGDVIEYVRNQKQFAGKEIALVGISLGSLAAIYQGLRYYGKGVNKIISIATMGNYSLSIPQSPILFKREWWVWVRYRLFGVPINPLPEMNHEMSPLLQIEWFLKKNAENTQLISNLKQNLVLIHAKNDPIISNSHFSSILATLGEESVDWLYTKQGGHNFIKYETIIISKIIQELKKVDSSQK